MNFILTIDTEADNQWDHGREITVENIKFIPRFQNLCERHRIKPTYLVTSEICEDNFAREIFKDYLIKGRAEIGAHLHSWTTPPFLDREGYRNNDKHHAFANELPEGLLTEKIKNLTNLIETSFGERPLSFRSGRYGFSMNVARILSENLYLVDSSVTPFISWTAIKGLPDGSGGPDFLEESPFPYRHYFSGSTILEIPITILPTKYPLNKRGQLAKYYFRNVDKSLFLRLLRKLFYSDQPLWLRPHLTTTIGMFNELLNEAKRLRLPFLVMMFHSSELMSGGSVYRNDDRAINKLYDLLDVFFNLLNKKQIGSVTLTEAAKSYTV